MSNGSKKLKSGATFGRHTEQSRLTVVYSMHASYEYGHENLRDERAEIRQVVRKVRRKCIDDERQSLP